MTVCLCSFAPFAFCFAKKHRFSAKLKRRRQRAMPRPKVEVQPTKRSGPQRGGFFCKAKKPKAEGCFSAFGGGSGLLCKAKNEGLRVAVAFRKAFFLPG